MTKAGSQRAQVVVVCVGLASLSCLYRFVGDQTIWGAWITIAPPMLVALLVVPTVIRLKSWLVAAFLAAFLAVTVEWPRFDSGTSDIDVDQTVRLVSWNVGAGNTAWASAVEPLAPDVVLVQESSMPLEAWDGFSWWGTPDPGALTHFPVEVLPTEKVGPWTEPQLLLIDIRGQKVLIANVRLMLPSVVIQLVAPLDENPLENYRARTDQYDKLAQLLRSTAQSTGADAVLVAGDFNIPARMPSLAPLRTFLRDAWLDAGVGWGATMPEFFPLTRIDHVWVSDGITIHAARVEKLAGSDHRAVVVDFTLEDEG